MNTLPRISLVTPSFNQAPFLEATIRSVLEQRYPNLQYGIVDGGSADGSRQILERYRDRLDFLIIERDRGQTDAINKGLRRADGEWVGWLCSDDLLQPGALHALADAITARPEATWIAGATRMMRADGEPMHLLRPTGEWSVAGVLLRGGHRPFELPQPGVFWRRELHDTLGHLRDDLHYCLDFEWWLRLLRAGHRPHVLDAELALYRLHETSKTCAAPEGFLREHVVVEREYARGLRGRDRFAAVRRVGYQRRALAVRHGHGALWREVVRRPWWLLSQQVRQGLRSPLATAA